MSITTNNPSFLTVQTTASLQDWESENPINFVYILNQDLPNLIVKQLKLKDLTVAQTTTYSSLRYAAKKTYLNQQYSEDWLSVESPRLGAFIPLSEINVSLNQSSAVDNLKYKVQNFNTLPVGNYQSKITYKIEGLLNGTWVTITSYDVFINFDIYASLPITWDSPATLNHVYGNSVFGNTTFTINGPSWKIETSNNILQLSCNDSSVIYGTDANRNWLTGSGTHLIKIIASAYHNTATALAQSPTNNLLFVYAGDTTYVGGIDVLVNVIETNFFASPTTIDFNVIKGEADPAGIIVDVFSLAPYTYTMPYWLTATVLSYSAPGIPNKLLVKPIPYTNLSAGVYSDNIVLSGINSGVPTDITIVVTYTIEDIITLPYSNEDYNFTKDPLLLNFHSDIPDTYFEMKAIINCSDFVFQSANTKTFEIPFKIPLFNKKQNFNLGKIIEKAMYRFENPLGADSNLYNSALVTLEIKEYLNNTNVFVRDVFIQNLKFLSGLTPNFKYRNNGFLDTSNGIKRVTPNSIEYINLMLTFVNQKSYEIFRNGTSIYSNEIYHTTQTHKLAIDFSTLSAVEGDIIEVAIWLNAGRTKKISKKYLVFPQQEFSTFIIWENEYRLPEIFDFTGKYSLKSDVENLQTKNFNEIIERTNLIDNSSTEKIIINTGFITSNDISYIKSIIKQRRAWVLLPSGRLIELIPTTKQLQEVDVNRELIDFDIEFQINKIYDEKNNSF